MKGLRYCMMDAHYKCAEDRHPLEVMKELGITYQHSTPQSMADQWWFWNCENIPEDLPKSLSDLGLNPMDVIGRGLDQETAEEIRDYQSK